MRTIFISLLTLLITSATVTADETHQFNEPLRKLSYSVGYQVGSDFRRQGVTINPELLMRGVNDGRFANEALMTFGNMRLTLADLQQEVNKRQEQKMLEDAKKNLLRGKKFLDINSQKEGVVTLPSGLQYKIIEQGSGETPGLSDSVTVRYRGTLLDGSVFDDSDRRKTKSIFVVRDVIQGWEEALQLMPQGSHWQLFVPSSLAYGDKRVGMIEPNSTLIFNVELLAVEKSGE